jgi:hypothetical protein
MFVISEDFFEIKPVFQGKGRGVFAIKEIAAGTVIGDYLGKIIHPDDEPKESEPMYTMYFSDEATILPDPQDPGVHIINHSCMPNLEAYTHEEHILYFALRRIFPGEELTIDYNLDPPDAECNPCTHACMCGAPMCRGSWHVSAQSMAKWEQSTHTHSHEHVPLPVAYGENLPPLSSYPSHVEDDVDYPMYGSLQEKPQQFDDQEFPTAQEIRQRIRKTGKQLLLPKFHTVIYGINQGLLISKLQ